MFRVLKAVCLFLGMGALSACVSLLPDAPPPALRYSLGDTTTTLPSTAEPMQWSLSIDESSASRVIDTTQIALVTSPQEYQYYAGGEWTERAPMLFNRSLIRSFENTAALTGVGARSNQPVADYILQTDIRTFEADKTSGALVANIDVYARLTDSRSRILASRRFTQSIAVTQDNAKSVAVALDEGAKEVMDDIIAWSLAEGERLEASSQ